MYIINMTLQQNEYRNALSLWSLAIYKGSSVECSDECRISTAQALFDNIQVIFDVDNLKKAGKCHINICVKINIIIYSKNLQECNIRYL